MVQRRNVGSCRYFATAGLTLSPLFHQTKTRVSPSPPSQVLDPQIQFWMKYWSSPSSDYKFPNLRCFPQSHRSMIRVYSRKVSLLLYLVDFTFSIPWMYSHFSYRETTRELISARFEQLGTYVFCPLRRHSSPIPSILLFLVLPQRKKMCGTVVFILPVILRFFLALVTCPTAISLNLRTPPSKHGAQEKKRSLIKAKHTRINYIWTNCSAMWIWWVRGMAGPYTMNIYSSVA